MTWLRVLIVVVVLPSLAVADSRGASQARLSPSCDPVPGLDSLRLEPGTVLLFGEIHGTTESPDLVADVVCHALQKRLAVRVALEVPTEETERVTAYLSSDGSTEAREALLSSTFWRRANQDGRSSRAVLELVDQLRRLRQAGGSIAVVLFDENEPPSGPGAREGAMAERLRAAIADASGELVVGLTGNIHARTTPGVSWDPDFEPMGHRLVRALPQLRFVTLAMSSTGGTAWTCASAEAASCGARKLQGRGTGQDRRITLFARPDGGGYGGTFHLGAMTASPPAVPRSHPDGGAQSLTVLQHPELRRS